MRPFAQTAACERAASKERAILGVMAQHDPLAFAGEDDAVVADDRAAAQRREADVALASRAGQAVAAARRMAFQRNASTFSRCFAKQERGS